MPHLIHAQIQESFSGGGGSRPDGQKIVWTTFVFILQLILQFTNSNSIETHITWDFPGGKDSYPPLWIRTYTYFTNIWAPTVRGQLDFQFLAQDFKIEEGGSQDFLIRNVSGGTVFRLDLQNIRYIWV